MLGESTSGKESRAEESQTNVPSVDSVKYRLDSLERRVSDYVGGYPTSTTMSLPPCLPTTNLTLLYFYPRLRYCRVKGSLFS